MITLELTGEERVKFVSILPAVGSVETLEAVDRILRIVNIKQAKEANGVQAFDFDKNDIDFMIEVVTVLDQAQKLPYSALSLIRKILNIKEQ